MGQFIAQKYLPEEAGVLLEKAIDKAPKKPPVFFQTHEERYIITQKDANIDKMIFTKPEMKWFCEADNKKLYGKKKRGRPRKKVHD